MVLISSFPKGIYYPPTPIGTYRNQTNTIKIIITKKSCQKLKWHKKDVLKLNCHQRSMNICNMESKKKKKWNKTTQSSPSMSWILRRDEQLGGAEGILFLGWSRRWGGHSVWGLFGLFTLVLQKVTHLGYRTFKAQKRCWKGKQ